ncbi:glycosyltransferase family 4 protein [Gramella sp. GC03-9]|uniref:Glycosyltransferase family 4 protein n=1 Tax=Christiangramia oceanisediminis TaxID=2920386 RepID=A0A9X2KYI6_9FLAO|nr:glycosyltransferase family 4 protein [Gramella oceanisediminis]MCP9200670.1 glycosyltransferase family 4 protein [Gramella oceanisediminis]
MKKVLIITYYWPPAGGPGVQRWLKFVKYLRDFEIEPVVYVPENPSYPILDESLNSEVPSNIKILKQKIFEPYSIAGIFSRKQTQTISSGIIEAEEEQTALQKALLFIRGNFFIPDARKFWIKPSVKFLKKELEKQNYEAIITTGPPHSLHLIGLQLKEQTRVKWIADFRDPWTRIGYHKKLKLTSSSQARHQKLEKKVLTSANHIITTSYTTREEFQNKTSKPVSLITNGFDISVNDRSQKKENFEISHIGSLLAGRNPCILWQSLAEIIKTDDDFKSHFRLRLAGRISEEVLSELQQHELMPFVVNEGYVNHSRAVEMQRQASILLLIEIDSEETRGIIPGKIFEYLAAKNPILAIGPENWDAAKIIRETKSGEVFNYNDRKELENYIREQFEYFKKGNSGLNSIGISSFHRRELTGQLAQLIHSL